jgi:hypothetical protein
MIARKHIFISLVFLVSLMLGGCHLPGILQTKAAPTNLTPEQSQAIMLRLTDFPENCRLAYDTTPANDIVASQDGDPQAMALLTSANRLGGSQRIFTLVTEEPSIYNGLVRLAITMDVFASPTGAQRWLTHREQRLAQTAGDRINVATPGQGSVVFDKVQRAADFAATTTTIIFTEHNLTFEIVATQLGLGVSFAEAERYAQVIDARIIDPSHAAQE